MFKVFSMALSGIEPESSISVADALFTRPLIGFLFFTILKLFSGFPRTMFFECDKPG